MKFLILSFVNLFLIAQATFAQSAHKTGDSIQIIQLKEIIVSLQQAKKPFKEFSLSSSAVDNITLNYDGKKFEIVYRPEKENLDLWVPKFQDFAMMSGRELKITETTDERRSKSGKPLSTTNITLKEKDAETTYELIRGIMLNVFRNAKNVYYQVVMPE